MKIKTTLTIPAFAMSALLIGCGEKEPNTAGSPPPAKEAHGHAHEGEDDHAHEGEEGHAHEEGEEVSLGTFMAGEMEIEAAQGHGMVEAGKEGHLVIKLPYKDDGASVVRAWIGTEDRTMSAVGKGDYAPSHDDYDIHAMAPSPLAADAKWWVEVEKPDGTKTVGSIAPKM